MQVVCPKSTKKTKFMTKLLIRTLPKIASRCDVCNTSFEDKAIVVSQLYEEDFQSFQRRDACSACFTVPQDGQLYWKQQFQKEEKVARSKSEQDQRAQELLLQPEDTTELELKMLALHLLRRRKLRLLRQYEENGSKFYILEIVSTQEQISMNMDLPGKLQEYQVPVENLMKKIF